MLSALKPLFIELLEYFGFDEMYVKEFLGSLISNPDSKFKNN